VERHSSAGVIVFVRSDDGCRFLLLRSRLTRRPIWEFPKGGIDAGENAHRAALRELREETGYAETDIRLLDGFRRSEAYYFTSTRDGERILVRKNVVYFLAEAAHTEVRISSHEASDFAWLPLDEAARRIRYAARRQILMAAAAAAGCDGEPTQSDATLRSREASARSGSDSA
jgi:8-oxo-dGTP pyrophosphatase MutT (NUDIX family)